MPAFAGMTGGGAGVQLRRHSEGWGPCWVFARTGATEAAWMPAFAGMTQKVFFHSFLTWRIHAGAAMG
jgi:hypothetical protein